MGESPLSKNCVCRTCRHSFVGEDLESFSCRRHPPTMGCFPRVDADWSCGEWAQFDPEDAPAPSPMGIPFWTGKDAAPASPEPPPASCSWLNLYRVSAIRNFYIGRAHPSREQADDYAVAERVACVAVDVPFETTDLGEK